MLTKIKSLKQLPYRLYIVTLLKNDIDISLFEDLEGYLIITKEPKMTMLYLEYQEGQSHKISKEIWNRIQLSYKLEKIEKNEEIDGKKRKIRSTGEISKQKQATKSSTI